MTDYNFKWIPVSEMLPEHDEDVLLCFKEGPSCPYYQIQVGSLGTHEVEDNNFEIIGYADVWYTDECYAPFEDVAAWMPLPEPYKEV